MAVVLLVFLILLLVAAIGGISYLVIRYQRKMREARDAWVQANRLRPFEAQEELTFLSVYQAWGPGYGHRNFHGYEGEIAGVPVRMWQHQSRTKSKDSENIHNFIVCKVKMPLSAPNLCIKQEHWGHKLVDALGGDDIDFESDEFSRKFWVKCGNRRFAYGVIHPRMMEFLLTAPKTVWQWQGEYLVLHVSGSFKPERVQPLLDAGLAFRALVPGHLAS